jgi:Flp pilus assembly protein TadG
MILVRHRPRNAASSSRGVELLEFALVLPFLLVLLVGIWDFGAAFALKQKTTNAAREAARIVVSTSLSDASCTTATPCSIVAAANAVVQYLNNAGLDASCVAPGSPSSSSGLSWTYSCSNGVSLVINRGYAVTSASGSLVPSTQVVLIYPYHWWLARFLPGYGTPAMVKTQVIMANLVY